MSDRTEISWSDSTFNPWIGCQAISPGCDHCYAAAYAKRVGRDFAVRTRTSPANWKKPEKWNLEPFGECSACGWRGETKKLVHGGSSQQYRPDCPREECAEIVNWVRRRVFCASLADVFDNEVDPKWRLDLFKLILRTPDLDWLVLTKRVGNVAKMLGDYPTLPLLPNIWLGATVVNQEEADRDIPKLLAVPAAVRFLSIEPMLGPIDLEAIAAPDAPEGECWTFNALTPGDMYVRRHPRNGEGIDVGDGPRRERGIDWIIAGGESGPKARASDREWFRSLRDQCQAAGVPFHFKQWGEWRPNGSAWLDRMGKKIAGRDLDGRTWDEFPR